MTAVGAPIKRQLSLICCGLQMPQWHKANPNDDPVIELALTSDTQPMSDLYDAANTLLSPRLSQLPGVASVDVSGSAQPGVRVVAPRRAAVLVAALPDRHQIGGVHPDAAERAGGVPLPKPVQGLMRLAAKVMTTVSHRI